MILDFSMKVVFFISFLLLISCENEGMLIPKPSTFLRSELPVPKYAKINSKVPYTFELNQAYSGNQVVSGTIVTPHLEIVLGKLNGVCYFNYYPIPNRDSLVRYINISNDKVGEHQVKAKGIVDQQFLFPEKKVYATLFELQGDVATNFQFYITDSVHHFARGEILMNCAPKYDSLRPSLDYIKRDLIHLIETFEWKK